MSVQYRTAKIDGDNRSVDIDYVYKERLRDPDYRDKHVFTCPCCGLQMSARLGEQRERHFSHIGTPCDPNYFLHSAAEETFYEEYKKCLEEGVPFTITVWSEVRCAEDCTTDMKSCLKRFKKQTIVLTDIYTRITPEKRVKIDGLHYRRPDLLLESDDGNQLWVEIWVSHQTDNNKRKEGDVLELKITDEKTDLETIRSHNLVQANRFDDKVRHYLKGVCQNPVSTPIIRYEPTIESPRQELTEHTNPKHAEKPHLEPQQTSVSERGKTHLSLNVDVLKEIPAKRNNPFFKANKPEWVDLGLPSGTLWSKEYMGSMSFEDAQERYPGMIPSPEQFKELFESSELTGPFPARLIGPNGSVLELYEGDFWTSKSLEDRKAVVLHREFLSTYHKNISVEMPGDCFAKADKRMNLCLRLIKESL